MLRTDYAANSYIQVMIDYESSYLNISSYKINLGNETQCQYIIITIVRMLILVNINTRICQSRVKCVFILALIKNMCRNECVTTVMLNYMLSI